jgi:hypothetical protein
MPAIIRSHVHFLAKDDSDALLRPGELLTHEAAELAGRTTERIRQLVRRHGVGRWEPRLRCYVVDRVRLLDHLARRKRKNR